MAVQNQMPHRRQGSAKFRDNRHAVKIATAMAHTVTGDQHFGLNLREAVQHGLAAHIGRADAPHRTHAHRRQESDHGLRYIGQVGCNTVAGLNALRQQMQGQ